MLEKSKLLILLYRSYLNMLKIEIKVKSTLRERSENAQRTLAKLELSAQACLFIERS